MTQTAQNLVLDPKTAEAQRKRRSLAIALGLGLWVIAVFIITLARLRGHALGGGS